MLKFISNGSTSVALAKIGIPFSNTLEYSTDGQTWSDYTVGELIPLQDSFVAFRGNGKFSKNTQNRYYFTTTGTGTISLDGDILSLTNTNSIRDAYQFNSLFSGCLNIVNAANLNLPLNTIKWCYANMFMDCRNLLYPPQLPATQLSQWCYSSMFGNCRKLTYAPDLPATTLAKYCYYCMFYNCKEIVDAPQLNASTLTDFCYNSMFFGCKKLNSIHCNFSTWSNATTNWVTGVEHIGTFFAPSTLPISTGVDCIPIGWEDYVITPNSPIMFKALDDTVNLRFKCNYSSSLSLNYSMNYKINDGAWQEYPIYSQWSYAQGDYYAGDYIELNPNDVVSFSGTEITQYGAGANDGYTFQSNGNGKLKVFGNVNGVGLKNSGSSWKNLFQNNNNIVDAYDLQIRVGPNTGMPTYRRYLCQDMFYNCTNLTAGPWCVPVDSSSTPSTPSTFSIGQYAFFRMFRNCSKLVKAPKIGSINVTNYSYVEMFRDCTSLTDAPQLPATYLAKNCYAQMFAGCTSLTSMNVNFTQWEYNGDDLTTLEDDATAAWVDNVAPAGVFYKPEALSARFGNTRIPTNWTVINK